MEVGKEGEKGWRRWIWRKGGENKRFGNGGGGTVGKGKGRKRRGRRKREKEVDREW